MLLVSSCVPVITWLHSRVMRFQSRPINWPLLTIKSPVAQWLEHPTRSLRVVGLNPIWDSDFFPISSYIKHHVILARKKRSICHYLTKRTPLVRPGSVVASWSVRSAPERAVRVRALAGTLCCVLEQDILLSRCLSPPRCIIGYLRM